MYGNTAVLKLQENREPEERIQEEEQARIKELKKELDSCEGVKNAGRIQVFNFMVREGIGHIAELGYEERVKFIEYLSDRYSRGVCKNYVNVFDRIKRQGLRRATVLPAGTEILIPPYKPEILYLPYHPDERVAGYAKRIHLEESLVWDFSVKASEKMKYQIYQMVHYIIDLELCRVMKNQYLVCLKRYYLFCVEHGIKDIEKIEPYQENQFERTLSAMNEKAYYPPVVSICKRELFLNAKEINWNADVWYLKRFHLQAERLDPSHPVDSLSFVEVTHAGNKKLLKDYMRYCIGITSLAINLIQLELGRIKQFLIKLEKTEGEDVRNISGEWFERYFDYLGKGDMAAKTFNAYLTCIHQFFCFLQVRGHIEKVPFRPEYYRQKCIPCHHDRSVVPETAAEILRLLHKMPENRRLIFLHLWCLGLRISEVCILKGNAYSRQNGDMWILVYQVKMRKYKRIPIPEALYELMQIYLKKQGIGPEDYVFPSRDGGPYRSYTFCLQMKRFCEENHIHGGEYLFRSHDYRHSVATEFYDGGVSLQSVRDYLGHDQEEMTQQYIDFMPKRIERANETFFEQHSLASCLRKGSGDK